MAHTPSSPRPTLLAASTTASYSSRSRTPPSATAAAAPALSPASTSNMVATNGDRNGGVSSHSQPNLGGSINSGVKGGGGDFLDVAGAAPAAAVAVGSDAAPRKCSTASASIMDLYGNSSQLGNRNMQRDIMAARSSACSASHSHSGAPRDPSGGSPGADPKKARKFLTHWKQASSLTKLGSREEYE